jgi:23S rRNA pseudouridine1911/1915/1917 synthase
LPSTVTVELAPEDRGERLDRVLARHLPDLSRSRLKALILEGQVELDGTPIDDPGLKLKNTSSVTIIVPDAVDPEPKAENIPLTIVYEDDDLIVIDKPAGLVVHPGAGNETGTLVNALIAHCGESLSGIGGVKRPGIVHRLDKDTSGLLVVAKNDAAHQALSAQFADHGRTGPLERAYRAIVWGRPDRSSGTIEANLDRSNFARDKMAVVRAGKGREAITHWQLEESFGDPKAPIASLLTCRLETGRTHQIRVHMAHSGHPLLGDATYGSGFKTKEKHLPEAAQEALKRLDRQALHAAELGFAHPRTREFMHFVSPLPQDFEDLLTALEG